jgi:hypothetical protein
MYTPSSDIKPPWLDQIQLQKTDLPRYKWWKFIELSIIKLPGDVNSISIQINFQLNSD